MNARKATLAVVLLVVLVSGWSIIPVHGSETVPSETVPSETVPSETVPTGVERIGAQALWDKNKDKAVDEGANAGDNVGVAIIDSGLYTDNFGNLHEDLNSTRIDSTCRYTVQWNYQTETVDITQGSCQDTGGGHGTHVAGTIAAEDNDKGVIGVAPHVYLSIFACGSFLVDEEAFANEMAAAINYIDEYKCGKVISISCGVNASYDVLESACRNAHYNELIVCAAGNWGWTGEIQYPAAYCTFENDRLTVAVGSIYDNGTLWESSNYIDDDYYFVAPGVDVNSTVLNNEYALMSGTSMACPHVSATAALIFNSAVDPNFDTNSNGRWDPDEVVQKLQGTSLFLDGATYGSPNGHRLVNALLANQRPEGDINSDQYTNSKDAVLLGRLYGTDSSSGEWNRKVDLNIDDFVNAKDAVILGAHFGWNSSTLEDHQLDMLTLYSTKLKVQPSTNTFYTDTTNVGQNFTISIITENTTDLYGWEFKLSWTAGMLNCTSATLNSNVWSSYLGPWVNSSIQNANGTYHQSLTGALPAYSFNGTTWLANLTFQILQAPPSGGSIYSDLTLSSGPGNTYCLLNSSAMEIPHDLIQGSFKYISARYMRSDMQTVNGLQAYKLDTSKTASYLETSVSDTESNTVYWGIRVWKRNSAGTETEITSGTPVAQVSRSMSGYGIQSASWNCPNTMLAATDSVVVRVYCMNSEDWILQATFTTARLNARNTNPATWNVYYWTKRNYISGFPTGRTIGYFRWGTIDYNSRIEDFTTT